MIVPRPVVVEPSRVVLAPSELVRIAAGRTGPGRVPERGVGVRGLNSPRAIGQGKRTAEGVGQECAQSGGIRPGEELIEVQAREEIRGRRAGQQALKVDVAPGESDRIFRNEPVQICAVVPRPVVVEASAVAFSTRELIRIRGGLPGCRRFRERHVGVRRLDRSRAVSERAAECLDPLHRLTRLCRLGDAA